MEEESAALPLAHCPKGSRVSSPRAWQQELTVDAALTGDRALALQALLADPLVPSVETAAALLDEALQTHEAYLPQFAGHVASLVH
jgi:alpha-galactosidase/6-phospho-beta-glucosidase family protein